jgi:DNA mismatch repair protein MutS2
MEAETAKSKYQKASLKLKESLKRIEEEKRELIESKRIEADKVLLEAREELKQAINALKKRKSTQTDVTERYDKVGRKLRDHLILEKEKGSSLAPGNIKKGISVYHKKLKQRGTVHAIEAFGERALVMLGHVKVSADIRDLEVDEKAQDSVEYKPTGYVSWDRQETSSRELNLVGYRVDDALALIDKTIDRALVGGELSLRIVHGYGTGRLRGAIREHLKAVPFVKKVSSAEQELGGNAITVVELN